MSFLPLTDVSSLGATASSNGLPVINQAAEPAAVRNGSAAAKQAYDEGLDFEQVLVNQLAQELTSTVSAGGSDSSDSSDSSGDDGSGGSDSDSGGLLGSDAAAGGYESMIPGALTSAIMSAGGTGLALALAQSIDPSAFAGNGHSDTAAAKPSTSPGAAQ
jgi:hypothetical protein